MPLLARWPGKIKPGTTDATPVCSIDILPTVLDLCGLKPDAKPDGVSLRSLFEGKALTREALYWHYPHYANQGSRPGGAALPLSKFLWS